MLIKKQFNITLICNIGFSEVSISTLKQLAVTKSQFVPTLNAVVPFLEVSSNQEYLVHRLRGEHYVNQLQKTSTLKYKK